MVIVFWVIVGVVAWLACGLVAGRIIKKMWLADPRIGVWRQEDETFVRILMLTGLAVLVVACLFQWFMRHPLRLHGSWFGKGGTAK